MGRSLQGGIATIKGPKSSLMRDTVGWLGFEDHIFSVKSTYEIRSGMVEVTVDQLWKHVHTSQLSSATTHQNVHVTLANVSFMSSCMLYLVDTDQKEQVMGISQNGSSMLLYGNAIAFGNPMVFGGSVIERSRDLIVIMQRAFVDTCTPSRVDSLIGGSPNFWYPPQILGSYSPFGCGFFSVIEQEKIGAMLVRISLAAIEFPHHMSFNAVSSSTISSDCSLSKQSQRIAASQEDENDDEPKKTAKIHLKHRQMDGKVEPKKSILESTVRDLTRIQTLHKRVIEKKNQNVISRLNSNKKHPDRHLKPVVPESYADGVPGQLVATLESGVSLGSGEYFIDVFAGNPPNLFSLILDTGSDLNWIQCVPCYGCFEQNGLYYDPKESISFRNVSCKDPRCHLVSSPDPPQLCKAENQTCPYYYWYGDSSNTTGDFALETFTVNLTSPTGNSEFRLVENVMFGCGNWNRGLFQGAAGLLGLGRGPLSFASQLQSLYGHSFSYCLVDRNSDTNVSSKLIFGENKDLLSHPDLNFASLVAGKENSVDTFYYFQIKSIFVGGTTLSYFADPTYQIIKDAFVNKTKGYSVMKDFPVLDPCYNVSGVENVEFPDFGIQFNWAVWNFPVENYFIWLEEDVVCLAILGTPRSGLSIIGNYQQQNFHIL
ncbi:Eukaryotic aspartyl protease family protein isoform 2 [Hibiscus syriacus]|uniref:Eukaryotic aspartyl protease family protein isoform 2 n=1 Tax=Hibiscus syriacus TaxID=106335 RepID=A0A6A2XVI8_HIBSY|nr:Eukaryotic aspartyl protease family protein isoform 2 [Hibiscus syriacus]